MRYESFRLIIIISKSHTETASNTEETTKYLKPVTKHSIETRRNINYNNTKHYGF